jgi:hypothetical protein
MQWTRTMKGKIPFQYFDDFYLLIYINECNIIVDLFTHIIIFKIMFLIM